MRIAVTGASGFIGRAVTQRLRETSGIAQVRLIDLNCAPDPDFETISDDLTAPGAIDRAIENMDCVVHLAALPGGAAERDPAASRRANCDVPLNLIERLEGRRLLLASSIAALGSNFDGPVTDRTPPRPASVYGTHKRMAELAFEDAARRGAISGAAIRLPGIVARPPSAKGFGSAFLSDIFHATREGVRYRVPVAPDATSWLMSAACCAQNLIHAATSGFTAPNALTLPALRVRIGALVEALGAQGDASGITYAEDAGLRRIFGSYPELETPGADALGFRHDGSLAMLIERGMANG